jgi:hypothetical protein
LCYNDLCLQKPQKKYIFKNHLIKRIILYFYTSILYLLSL